MGEGREGVFENAMDIGDGNAVVGDGDTGLFRVLNARKHFLAVDHAPAAANYKFVTGQILIQKRPRVSFENNIFTRKLPDPAGQLHPADIIGHWVMGAGLHYQHHIIVLQPFDLPHASDEFREITFLT